MSRAQVYHAPLPASAPGHGRDWVLSVPATRETPMQYMRVTTEQLVQINTESTHRIIQALGGQQLTLDTANGDTTCTTSPPPTS